jgi:hypothetical protein
MQAKCYCPKHGRLDFDGIMIKNGTPICSRCSAELQFGVVKPRFDVNGKTKKKKPKK